MKSIILYSSLNPGAGRTKLETPAGAIYIRSEVVECENLEALDLARPNRDETVLNSINAPTDYKDLTSTLEGLDKEFKSSSKSLIKSFEILEEHRLNVETMGRRAEASAERLAKALANK